MRWLSKGLNRFRGIKLESPEGKIVHVTSEVGHRTAAEIPPSIPLRAGKIDLVIRAVGRWANPQIPIQVGRWHHFFGGSFRDIEVFVRDRIFLTLKSPGSRSPNVCFVDLSDGSRLDQFHNSSIVLFAVNLRSHLCRDVCLTCRMHYAMCLSDVMSERLLAIDRLLEL